MDRISILVRHGARFGAIALLLLVVSGCEQEAPVHGCQIETWGAMAVLNTSGSPIVRAGINGHAVAMIVDSGAELSVIDPAQATKLGLDLRYTNATLRGLAGDTPLSVAEIQDFDLGTTKGRDALISAGGKFSGTVQGVPIVGLFGSDYLANYELVVDMPQHYVEMVRVHGCPGPTPTWSGPVHSFELRHFDSKSSMIQLTAVLDGRNADTFLDTGATHSTVSLSFAHDAGVTQDMLDRDRRVTIVGIADQPAQAYVHRFQTLKIGDTVMHNIDINVTDTLDDVDMLLGADFLRHHRIWIKWGEGRGYFQYDKDIPGFDRNGAVTR